MVEETGFGIRYKVELQQQNWVGRFFNSSKFAGLRWGLNGNKKPCKACKHSG
jgi:hypothetical protein